MLAPRPARSDGVGGASCVQEGGTSGWGPVGAGGRDRANSRGRRPWGAREYTRDPASVANPNGEPGGPVRAARAPDRRSRPLGARADRSLRSGSWDASARGGAIALHPPTAVPGPPPPCSPPPPCRAPRTALRALLTTDRALPHAARGRWAGALALALLAAGCDSSSPAPEARPRWREAPPAPNRTGSPSATNSASRSTPP